MMKATVTIVFVSMLMLGYQVAPSVGFIPTKLLEIASKALSFSLEDAITHEEMTRNALLEVAAEVLRDNPNPSDAQSSQRLSALSSLDEESLITAYYGYHDHTRIDTFENAIEAIKEANSDTDFGEEKEVAAAHFDSEQFESGQNRLINLRHSIISLIISGNVFKAREDTGHFLHALQDFYSHSNWIENGNRAPNRVLGQPNQWIDNMASPTQQSCGDCVKKGWFVKYYECNNNIDHSLKRDGTLTSGYFGGLTDDAGREIQKPNGKCSHGGFTDSTRDTFGRGGINKDGPYYRTSPHHYLHYEAAAVAQQATIGMFHDVRRIVNNDQLFGVYLGIFLSQAAIESMTAGNGVKLPMKSQQKRLPEILVLQYAKQIYDSKLSGEDKEMIAARIADLYVDIQNMYQSESQAKRQRRSVNSEAEKELENGTSSAVSASPLLPMGLMVMTGLVLIYFEFL